MALRVPKPLPEKQKDVHTENCCIIHGCKYGEDDYYCTVATNKKPQSFPCEKCTDSDVLALKVIAKIIAGKIKRCPYCQQVMP